MYKAELRARSTGKVAPTNAKNQDEPDMEDLSPVSGAPMVWWHAALPVVVVIFATIYGLLDSGLTSLYDEINISGLDYTWSNIWGNLSTISPENNPGFFKKTGMVIGASDSYSALLSSSLLGLIVAIVITLAKKIMNLFDTVHWMAAGFKTMIPALIILSLAWALSMTTDQLHTADFLSYALTGNINPYFFPGIIFVIAAVISFSTGSSWSTMAILYPIAIPTTYTVSIAAGLPLDVTMELMYSVIATVLSASVLGDHCSPISDTTILSSLASDCNHLDHVKTQLPYALTVGGVALVCKLITSFFGGIFIVEIGTFAFGILILYLIIQKFGKVVEVA